MRLRVTFALPKEDGSILRDSRDFVYSCLPEKKEVFDWETSLKFDLALSGGANIDNLVILSVQYK